MSRLLSRAIAAALALGLTGCAARRAPPAATATASASRDPPRVDVCAAPTTPVSTSFAALPTADLPEGERVVEVAVRGARTVPSSMILAVMKTRAGTAFDGVEADADLLRIEALSAFEDVRLGWERSGAGIKLTVDVDERPSIGAVTLAPGAPALEAGAWVPPLPGDLYEPAAVDRALLALVRGWQAKGHLDARAQAHAVRVDPERVDLCLDLDPGPAWLVERVEPVGTAVVSADELSALVDTHDAACNMPGKPYRADLLRPDILRMSALLWDRGLLASRVGTPRVTRIRERSALRVEIPVTEGKVYRIGKITFSGRLAGPRSTYAALMKPASGEVFSRKLVMDSLEKMGKHHRAHAGKGHVSPEIDLRERGVVDLVIQVQGS